MARGFVTKPKKFTSWSNSRWNDYAKCPAYAHYKHIQKLPEPKSPAMDRGIQVAKMEEDFFTGKLKTLPVWKGTGKVESPTPEEAKEQGFTMAWPLTAAIAASLGIAIHPALAPKFKEIKKQKDLMVEQNWGFDRNWNEVDYFDWTNCWLRVKVDVGWGANKKGSTVCHLVDNKTGKFSEYDNEKYLEQLNLYAAAGAAKFPWIEEFHVQLYYTDLGITFPATGPKVITRAEALALQKKFSKQVAPMFNDERFDPKPNNGCRWCAFSKAKGGPCKF